MDRSDFGVEISVTLRFVYVFWRVWKVFEHSRSSRKIFRLSRFAAAFALLSAWVCYHQAAAAAKKERSLLFTVSADRRSLNHLKAQLQFQIVHRIPAYQQSSLCSKTGIKFRIFRLSVSSHRIFVLFSVFTRCSIWPIWLAAF